MMAELRTILHRLELGEYADTFISEGFDTWQTLSDITESDLNDLNVKLGHRRKLQRAIADSKIHEDRMSSSGYDSPSHHHHQRHQREGSHDGSVSAQHNGTPNGNSSPRSSGGTRTKRKYRRHPKADANAPERSASAYVRFSNRMRQELADQALSFIEMAKVVGDRWQALPSSEREWYESQASAAKEKYNAEMARYKRTEEYASYQQYLADFKSKGAPSSNNAGTGKRAKLDAESSYSSSDDPGRRCSIVSGAASDAQSLLDSSGNVACHSVSPHASALPSPHVIGADSVAYRPSASPSTLATQRPSIYDLTRLPQPAANHSRTSSSSRPSIPSLETGASSASYSSRSPLSHSIPSLASETSDRSVTSVSTPDPATRVLPLPIPGRGMYNSGPRPLKPETDINDPRQSGSLAALLRAGELVAARDNAQSSQGHAVS